MPKRFALPTLGLALLIAVSACGAPNPNPTPPAAPAPAAGTPAPASKPSGGAAPSAAAAPAGWRAADGSCHLPPALAGHDFESIPGGRKVVALTFDGGSSNAADAKILQVLSEKGVTATFFFTGAFAEAYPDTVRTIAAKYPIGNHSFTHPQFTKISDARVADEITRAEAAIVKASGGVTPAPLFRFPFGDVNAHAITAVNGQCYVPFRWSIDTVGYNGTSGGNSVAKILALVDKKVAPGAIILMHQGDNPTDHSTLDADALPAMIDSLRAKGYSFVALTDALRG